MTIGRGFWRTKPISRIMYLFGTMPAIQSGANDGVIIPCRTHLATALLALVADRLVQGFAEERRRALGL